MSPLVAVRPLRSVVEKLAKLIGLCVTVTLSEAVKLILDALSIVGTPVPVLTILSAVILPCTTKSFCTVRSLLVVTAGVIVIPLESSVSITLELNVKLPIVDPPTLLTHLLVALSYFKIWSFATLVILTSLKLLIRYCLLE